MHRDIEEVLVSENQLREKTKELAKKITKDFQDKDFIMVTILKGGFIFSSDLVREIDLNVNINFMVASSYADKTESSGDVKIVKDINVDVKDKSILIVEDIVDSGRTLSKLKQMFLDKGAAEVKICTILDKPSRRVVPVDIDYLGFEIPDKYVVGYGLDFAERYRNLPYVGVLKKEIYS